MLTFTKFHLHTGIGSNFRPFLFEEFHKKNNVPNFHITKSLTVSLSCIVEKNAPLIDCIYLPIGSGEGLTFLLLMTRGALNLPEVCIQTAGNVLV